MKFILTCISVCMPPSSPPQGGSATLCAAEALPLPAAVLRPLATECLLQSGKPCQLPSNRNTSEVQELSVLHVCMYVCMTFAGAGDVAELHSAMEILWGHFSQQPTGGGPEQQDSLGQMVGPTSHPDLWPLNPHPDPPPGPAGNPSCRTTCWCTLSCSRASWAAAWGLSCYTAITPSPSSESQRSSHTTTWPTSSRRVSHIDLYVFICIWCIYFLFLI